MQSDLALLQWRRTQVPQPVIALACQVGGLVCGFLRGAEWRARNR